MPGFPVLHYLPICLVIQSCQDSATPWTVAHQAPLSIEFSRWEYWSCHALLQGIFPIQGSNPGLLHCRQEPAEPSEPSREALSLPKFMSIVGDAAEDEMFRLPSKFIYLLFTLVDTKPQSPKPLVPILWGFLRRQFVVGIRYLPIFIPIFNSLCLSLCLC